MLLRSPLRWHTFRVMILTSLVWVIFGMCILVYYMECIGGNGVNCRSKGMAPAVPAEPVAIVGALGDTEGRSPSGNAHFASDEDWPYLKLPPYGEAHLHTWVAPSKFICITLL